jgi:hypothetical protein
MQCRNCMTPMVEGTYSKVAEGVVWRCRGCRATTSLRKGSFFDRSKLPLTKLADLVYYWSMEVTNLESVSQVRKSVSPQCTHLV